MSQPGSISQAANDTGNIPLRTLFVYAPNFDGRIAATISWDVIDGELCAHVYALVSDGVPAALPLPGQKNIAERIKMLRDADALMQARDLIFDVQQVFRIDTLGPWAHWTMIVSLADEPPVGVGFVPGAIYGYFPNGKEDPSREGEWPSAITRETLRTWEIMRFVLSVSNIRDAHKAKNTDAEMVIWDLGAMHRSKPQPDQDWETNLETAV
jgi:hypothetical protein